MFGRQFYPTPGQTIAQMLEPYRKMLNDNCYILEPSVGKGDIAKFISENYKRAKIYGIELDFDLAEIASKYCTIVGNDFLDFENDVDFDLIVMNPPFENGDEHLIQAWEIMRNGYIVCLLNADTIRNPYSERRKLLARIIEDNGGSVEFIGNAFSDAERKTDVEVAMVRLEKKTETMDVFGDFDIESFDFKEALSQDLATVDMIGNIVTEYERAKSLFADGVEKIRLSRSISSSISKNYDLKPFEIAGKDGTIKQRIQEYTEELKMGIWNKIAEELEMENLMTSSVRNGFREKMKKQGALAITHKNIRAFADALFQNSGNILDASIQSVFDIFTQYHKENRCHVEGWKTNDKWKVNKRVIFPYGVEWDEWTSKFRVSWGKASGYADIDRAMCYITGDRYESIITIEDALNAAFGNEKTAESTFFRIKYFKKGTVHLEFKDYFLWQEFNMRACAGKNWLPEGERKEWEESPKYVQKHNLLTA